MAQESGALLSDIDPEQVTRRFAKVLSTLHYFDQRGRGAA
jgi:hypothetical protein